MGSPAAPRLILVARILLEKGLPILGRKHRYLYLTLQPRTQEALHRERIALVFRTTRFPNHHGPRIRGTFRAPIQSVAIVSPRPWEKAAGLWKERLNTPAGLISRRVRHVPKGRRRCHGAAIGGAYCFATAAMAPLCEM